MESLQSLEKSLTGEQRLHLNILIQAREDFVIARDHEYIDENGYIDESAFRYKGKGKQLVGGFNTPMTVAGLYELALYWQSGAPLLSINALGIPDIDAFGFLKRLNKAAKNRIRLPSRMPLDTL
jgi:hypothetical protein